MKTYIAKNIPFAAIISMMLTGFVSCSDGAPASGSSAAGEEKGTEMTNNDPIAKGAAIYQSKCVICHRANGSGLEGTIPPLAKSDYLKDRHATISSLITGLSGPIVVNGVDYNNTMPPQNLSDEEIAQVLTYVYQSFGNEGAAVTIAEVQAVRTQKQ